jgi:hypothetical protein
MSTALEISKGRSPRYPRIPLQDAIVHARALYDGAHRSVISSDTAYRVMGFNGKNGSSATALGAVRQFGLVDGLRGDLRISNLALRLLEPSSREEYVIALKEAATQPEVFSELFSHFDGVIPKSDEPVRSYLIRSLNFSRSGADECIESLRRTLSDVEKDVPPASSPPAAELDGAGDGLSKNESVAVDVETLVSHAIPARVSIPEPSVVSSDFVRIPLTRNCVAELRFSGPISGDAVQRLIKYIELMKDVWAED